MSIIFYQRNVMIVTTKEQHASVYLHLKSPINYRYSYFIKWTKHIKMTKSIEKLKYNLTTLKELYEICGIDISNIKEAFDLYYNVKWAIRRNRDNQNHHFIYQHNLIIKSTEEVYKQYKRINNIGININKLQRESSNSIVTQTSVQPTIDID